MSDSQAVASAKRGRGRPRKDPSETLAQKKASMKANGSIMKGKPGRKPGSKNKPKPEGVEKKTPSGQSGDKRGRGRPRKDGSEPSTPKKKSSSANSGDKRGRGRPRKEAADDSSKAFNPQGMEQINAVQMG